MVKVIGVLLFSINLFGSTPETQALDKKSIRFFESDFVISKAIVEIFESSQLQSFDFNSLKDHKKRFKTNNHYAKYKDSLEAYSYIYNTIETKLVAKRCYELKGLDSLVSKKLDQLCFTRLFDIKMPLENFSNITEAFPSYKNFSNTRALSRKYKRKHKLNKKTKRVAKVKTEADLLIDDIKELRRVSQKKPFDKKLFEDKYKNVSKKISKTRLLKNYKVEMNIFYLTKTLFRHKHIPESQEIIKSQINQAHWFKEDFKFELLWSYIAQDKYKEAYNKIIKNYYNLEKQSEITQSKHLYWVAEVLKKNEKSYLSLINQLQEEHPLSYYSILVQNSELYDPIEKYNDVLDFKNFTPTTSQRRYLAFIRGLSANKSKVLISKEIKKFLSSLKKNRNMFTYVIVNQLQKDLNYLESFKIVYRGIAKGHLSANRDFLNILYPRPYIELIKKNSKGIDPYLALSLIRQESSFDKDAISRVGARGLMQLMPKTAESLDRKKSVKRLNIPRTNIKLGIKYLKQLHTTYDKNFVDILSSYNAGERNLKKWKKMYFSANSTLKNIENIPFNETRKYVKLIFRNMYFYNLLDKMDGRKPARALPKLFTYYLETKR